MINGRRQPSRGVTSRISREAYVRFCEGLGVKFPGPTRHSRHSRHPGVSGSPQERTFRQSRVYEQARKGVYSQIRFLEAQLSQCPLAQKAGCCVAANCASLQSMTSSALISIAAGIVRPSVSKVFLLMTRRKWVGCSNGRSAGRAPLKIRSARSAARS